MAASSKSAGGISYGRLVNSIEYDHASFTGIVTGGEPFSMLKPMANPKQLKKLLEDHHCKRRGTSITGVQLPINLVYPSPSYIKCLDHAFQEDAWSYLGEDLFQQVSRMGEILVYVVALEIVATLETRPLTIDLEPVLVQEGDTGNADSAEVNKMDVLAADHVMMGTDASSARNVGNLSGNMTGAGRKGTTVSALQIRKNQAVRERSNIYLPLLSDLHKKMEKIKDDFVRSVRWHLAINCVPERDRMERQRRMDAIRVGLDKETVEVFLLQLTGGGGDGKSKRSSASGLSSHRRTATNEQQSRRGFIAKVVYMLTEAIGKTPVLCCHKHDRSNLVITEYGGDLKATNYDGDDVSVFRYSDIRENKGDNKYNNSRKSAITPRYIGRSEADLTSDEDDDDYNWGSAGNRRRNGKKGRGNNVGISTTKNFIAKPESFLSKILPTECKYMFMTRSQAIQSIKRETQTTIVVRTIPEDEQVSNETQETLLGKMKVASKGASQNKLSKAVIDEFLGTELDKIEQKSKAIHKTMPTDMKLSLYGRPTMMAMANRYCDNDVTGDGSVCDSPDGGISTASGLKKRTDDLKLNERLLKLNSLMDAGNNLGSTLSHIIPQSFYAATSSNSDPSAPPPSVSQLESTVDGPFGRSPFSLPTGMPSAMDLGAAGGSLGVSSAAADAASKIVRRNLDEIEMQTTLDKVNKSNSKLSKELSAVRSEQENMRSKIRMLTTDNELKTLTALKMKSDMDELVQVNKQTTRSLESKEMTIEQLKQMLHEMMKQTELTSDERNQLMALLVKKTSSAGGMVTSMGGTMAPIGSDDNTSVDLDTRDVVHSLFRTLTRKRGKSEGRDGRSNKRARFIQYPLADDDPLNMMTRDVVELLLVELNIIVKPIVPETTSENEMNFNNSILSERWTHDRLINKGVTEVDCVHKTPPNILMDTVNLKMIDVSPDIGLRKMTKDIQTDATRLHGSEGGVGVDSTNTPASFKYMSATFPKNSDTNALEATLTTQWEKAIKNELKLSGDNFTKTGQKVVSGHASERTIYEFIIPYLKRTFGHLLSFDHCDKYVPLLPSLEKRYKTGEFDGSLLDVLDTFFGRYIQFERPEVVIVTQQQQQQHQQQQQSHNSLSGEHKGQRTATKPNTRSTKRL